MEREGRRRKQFNPTPKYKENALTTVGRTVMTFKFFYQTHACVLLSDTRKF